jgi:hypothetical protein
VIGTRSDRHEGSQRRCGRRTAAVPGVGSGEGLRMASAGCGLPRLAIGLRMRRSVVCERFSFVERS